MIPAHWITSPFRWLGKTRAMLRELRTEEQSILGTLELIADELRHNAHVLSGIEASSSLGLWARRREEIRLDRWQEYGAQLSVFRKRHPDLWQELRNAYSALQQSVKEFDPPTVSSEALDELATRLDGVNL